MRLFVPRCCVLAACTHWGRLLYCCSRLVGADPGRGSCAAHDWEHDSFVRVVSGAGTVPGDGQYSQCLDVTFVARERTSHTESPSASHKMRYLYAMRKQMRFPSSLPDMCNKTGGQEGITIYICIRVYIYVYVYETILRYM